MRFSVILAVVPAAMALVAPPTHMKRDDIQTALQQVEAACNSATGAITSLQGQSTGNVAEVLQGSQVATDEHCAGLRDVLGRVAAAISENGANFAGSDESAAGQFSA